MQWLAAKRTPDVNVCAQFEQRFNLRNSDIEDVLLHDRPAFNSCPTFQGGGVSVHRILDPRQPRARKDGLAALEIE